MGIDERIPDKLNRYQGCRVIVLGASGFIGRWVARKLTLCRADLHLFVRNPDSARHVFDRFGVNGILWDIDLSHTQQLVERIRYLKPAIIFNLAGYGVDHNERDEEIAYQINSNLVERISAALLESFDPTWDCQRLVHTGSALEYGVIGGDLSEDSTPFPTTVYGRSKLAGTMHIKHYGIAHGLKGVTARLFTVYGPGEHEGRLLPSLIKYTENEDPLPLTEGRQKRDFVFVGDVAEGLLRLGISSAEPGSIINLATGRLTSVREFVLIASDILNIPRERLHFGELPTRTEEMEHQPVNNQSLVRLLNWTPSISIAEGVKYSSEFGNTNKDL